MLLHQTPQGYADLYRLPGLILPILYLLLFGLSSAQSHI